MARRLLHSLARPAGSVLSSRPPLSLHCYALSSSPRALCAIQRLPFHSSRFLLQEQQATTPPTPDTDAKANSSEPTTEEGANDPAKEETTDSEEVVALKEELKQTKEQLEKLQAEKEKILRAAAELQNQSKALQRDMAKTKEYGIQKFAESLLSVADNLQLTLEKEKKVTEDPESPAAKLYQAVLLTEKTLLQAFEKHDIVKYESLGQSFDPALHDGQFELEHEEHPPGHVGAVLSEGFKLKDRVIRPAKVGTVRKPEE